MMIKTMKRPGLVRAWALALAGTALTVPGAALLAQSSADLQPVVNATVRVEALSTGRTGTGWVIAGADEVNRAGGAVIVTALNVVDGSSAIKVSEPASAERRDAIILARDPDRNLAFLEVKDIAAQPIPLARLAPKLGRSVYAAGYNRAADDSERASAATASTKNGSLAREYRGAISTAARADVNQLELDATLIPGYEGGPLVDDCGRVVGVNMKSGGKVVDPAGMKIDPASTVINALKSDEVIAAANTYRVEYKAQDGACGSSAAATPPASEAAASEAATDAPVAPVAAPAGFQPAEWIKANLVLVALLLLGVIAALFGIITLTRRKDDPVAPPPAPVILDPATRRPEPVAPSEVEPGTVLLGDSRPATATLAELRLTGRGPAGEAIDIRIPGASVQGKTVTLGVGGNADHKIVDNRLDHKVSRLHALVGHDGRQFTIEDNKSLNGTRIDGRVLDPHTPSALVHGDSVSFADITLKVTII